MKNILFILVTLLIIGLSNKIIAQSKIKGTLTYYFNKYQGDKPDIGAKIYVIDTSKVQDFDYKIYYKFNTARTYRHIYNNDLYLYTLSEASAKKYKNKKRFKEFYDRDLLQMEQSKKSMDDSYNELVKVGAETEEKFNDLDKLNFKNILKITLTNEYTLKTIADGIGNFSLDVDPATYYVIVQSKGRTGLSVSDGLGIIYYENITVGENKTVNISNNFR